MHDVTCQKAMWENFSREPKICLNFLFTRLVHVFLCASCIIRCHKLLTSRFTKIKSFLFLKKLQLKFVVICSVNYFLCSPPPHPMYYYFIFCKNILLIKFKITGKYAMVSHAGLNTF